MEQHLNELHLLVFFSANLLGSSVSSSGTAKHLGVIFGSTITFSDHVSALFKACFLNIRVINRIGCFLNPKSAVILVNKLDYCNSLLSSIDPIFHYKIRIRS